MQVEITPSEVGDVYKLAANLRELDRMEMTGLDLDPATVIRTSYRSAMLRRTAWVDGEIAAMWGLGGVMLSDEGSPWLLTTPTVTRVPVTFVKVAQRELREMLRLRNHLSNVVLASYREACRLLEVLGFTLDAPEPLGARAIPYRRFWMSR